MAVPESMGAGETNNSSDAQDYLRDDFINTSEKPYILVPTNPQLVVALTMHEESPSSYLDLLLLY